MKLLDKVFIYGTYILTVLAWGTFIMGGGKLLWTILISVLCFFMYRYHKSF